MPKYRSGASAIEDAAARKGGGNRAFVPEIFWKDDGEKKYILVLTPKDEVGAFDLHEWIPLEGKKANGETYKRYEAFMSRKDPFIGEDYDKIEDDLGRSPKTRCMGVAVELEPVMEVVKGRKRPTGFSVKTDDYTRNTDDGEETVTFPVIGLICQSSALMWSPLASLDDSQGPLEELPLEVIRRIPNGEKANTRYDFVPFMDIPVDLSAVVDHLEGIGYLADTLEELIPELESIGDDDLKAAQAVARALFEKRINELADGERYEELVGDLDELPAPPWGGGDKKKGSRKSSRPARKSQRQKDESDEDDSESAEEPEPSKDDRFAKLKAKIESNAS